MISYFKDKVLLPEQEFEQILIQRTKAYTLAEQLRDRLLAEHALLLAALQQLAVERGAKDSQYFAKTWLREQRRERSA